MEIIFIGILFAILIITIIILAFRPTLILAKDFVKDKVATPHSNFYNWKENEIYANYTCSFPNQ